MRTLLAIVLPPLAVLLCGRPLQALFNVVLTLCFWVPGSLHAILVVNDHHQEGRTRRILRAIEQRG